MKFRNLLVVLAGIALLTMAVGTVSAADTIKIAYIDPLSGPAAAPSCSCA